MSQYDGREDALVKHLSSMLVANKLSRRFSANDLSDLAPVSTDEGWRSAPMSTAGSDRQNAEDPEYQKRPRSDSPASSVIHSDTFDISGTVGSVAAEPSLVGSELSDDFSSASCNNQDFSTSHIDDLTQNSLLENVAPDGSGCSTLGTSSACQLAACEVTPKQASSSTLPLCQVPSQRSSKQNTNVPEHGNAPGSEYPAKRHTLDIPETAVAAVVEPRLARNELTDDCPSSNVDNHGMTSSDTYDVDKSGSITPSNQNGRELDACAVTPKPDTLPTLARYPTANCHSWSEPPYAKFKVRGKTYLRDKNPSKIASGPFIFKAIGADIILTDATSGPSNAIATNYSTTLGGLLRNAPTFIINFICPWGMLLNYYQIPDLYLPYLQANEHSRASLHASAEKLEPHEKAIARFFMGTDEERNATLKLIPVATEGPFLVKKMVQGEVHYFYLTLCPLSFILSSGS